MRWLSGVSSVRYRVCIASLQRQVCRQCWLLGGAWTLNSFLIWLWCEQYKPGIVVGTPFLGTGVDLCGMDVWKFKSTPMAGDRVNNYIALLLFINISSQIVCQVLNKNNICQAEFAVCTKVEDLPSLSHVSETPALIPMQGLPGFVLSDFPHTEPFMCWQRSVLWVFSFSQSSAGDFFSELKSWKVSSSCREPLPR